ncbi:protein kinase [Gemmata sp. G18]|uniref:Protein kinase n=1 Tax=Gemmata palustris TaxID=2822762 RepID=A0ABS5BJZ0_9BACT|nr:serine/threonine-protein kinase [Gemmata palustris]MBP3954024.1 protein kinase [Gemmata palustris]
MTPHQDDQTVHSQRVPTSALSRTEPDVGPDTSSPSQAHDATIVRVAPSAVTVNEMADAANFGRYELVGELARGGMGVVYRARQHGLDRLVALKMILDTGTDKEAAQRFLQEARAAAALDHPNVVPIYDIDEIGGRPYFTMALIEGPNLRGYVDANGLPSIPVLVSLFAQIVSGVAHAHKHGIVHRDLKPANVLIDKDGRPRVTDFGLAKRSSVDSNLTATGQVVGTPAYMAPEQARDSKDVGPPADVYALGAILYFMLTGQAPFHAESVTDLLIKVVMEPPVPPRQLQPEVPPDVEALCLRCLAKAPADRFADAQELMMALAPITDQYLTPSANLTPSAAQIAFPKARTTPSIGSIPFTNAVDSVPSLGAALPKLSAAAPATEPVSAVDTTTKAPNRKPQLIALGAIAVALLGAAGYLVTRDKTRPDAPVAENGTAPDAKSADQFTWPVVARADFGLKVELVAPAAAKSADGIIQLTAGTAMNVHLKADRDCRVSVWVLDPAGHAMRLFPNDDEPDDRLTANRERVVPGNAKYTLETTPTEGTGADRLRVIATTGAQPAFPEGVKNGRFTVYSAEKDREKLASTVRGVVVKKSGTPDTTIGSVTEAELQFRVKK